MIVFLMLMLLPITLFAQTIETCAEWWECPYRSPVDEPTYRYVSIDDLNLPFTWVEIEIPGNKAFVCVAEPLPPGDSADCTRLTRAQVRGSRLRPPFRAYWDAATNSIQFIGPRRKFNVESIKRRIKDSALADTILQERNDQN